MIDDSSFAGLWRVYGSVIPRSLIWGVLGAVEGYLLDASDWQLFAYRVGPSSQGDSNRELWHHPYSIHVFGMVIGFALVMRVQIAYARFWEGATNLKMMSSKMGDAMMQIITFDEASKDGKPTFDEASLDFRLQIVHYGSLYHAVALSEIRQDDLEIGGKRSLTLNREDPYVFNIYPSNSADVDTGKRERRCSVSPGMRLLSVPDPGGGGGSVPIWAAGTLGIGGEGPRDSQGSVGSVGSQASSTVTFGGIDDSNCSSHSSSEAAAARLAALHSSASHKEAPSANATSARLLALGCSHGLPPTPCAQHSDATATQLANLETAARMVTHSPQPRCQAPPPARCSRLASPAAPALTTQCSASAAASVPLQQVIRERRQLNRRCASTAEAPHPRVSTDVPAAQRMHMHMHLPCRQPNACTLPSSPLQAWRRGRLQLAHAPRGCRGGEGGAFDGQADAPHVAPPHG